MAFEIASNIRISEDESSIIILDQTLLPGKTEFLRLSAAEDFFEAIANLRVRGAPAIGIFAAFSLYVLARQISADSFGDFYEQLLSHSKYLDSARPTAVNLSKQLGRMLKTAEKHAEEPVSFILDAMREMTKTIMREDEEMCRAISEHGLGLLEDRFGVLTYCNAGPLATSRYGTGLGPILLAKERGMQLRVFSCETRPLLQGARITAYELQSAGVDCTLICDNMASIVMKEGKIDAVLVGSDRVACNGDCANKIGTSGIAILSRHYGIPFYVLCPSTSIDYDSKTGAEFIIEQRPPEEILEMFSKRPIAPDGVKCYNPAFDVTDGSLVTAIITETGVHNAPYLFKNN